MARTRNAAGEMPFLDHLEELRWRILWSLLAVVAGSVVGYVAVQHFDVLGLLKRPIEPFLPEGRLMVTRPADAFLITLKLSVFVGFVLGLPVIIWHTWRFLAPALYQQERRFMLPALVAGLLLFGAGVALGYLWVLPAALRILLSFQSAHLETLITADAYFTFAAMLLLAFGGMFELPLAIVLLAATGLVSPDFFRKHRPAALVIAAIVAAFLTPPDAVSMLMMLGPIMLLYEIGIVIARVLWRRREAAIGMVLAVILLGLSPAPTAAQQDTLLRGGRRPADSLRQRAEPVDTAAARQLGLPTEPSRGFPAADSVLTALLARAGYKVTRYAADSMVLHADSQAIELVGAVLVRQDDATLEADTVRFRQDACALIARGEPTLFQAGTVLVGQRMRYDTCARIGYVGEAITSFAQSGVDWILRAGEEQGGLSIDSASVRIYAGHTDITSCDLADPHYHFSAGSVKWVSNSIMVSRPVVLYIRDIPVLWLPFMFQDMRPGRRSGLLAPRFGINDLIRPNRGYRRHIANIGYYVALSDYFDVQASLDWFDDNYVKLNGELRYRWLNRFVGGGLAVSRLFEAGRGGAPGGRSLRVRWNHQQNFDLETSLNASVDYANSARVIERNTADPFVATASLASNINFSKRFGWGHLAIGASRRQSITSGGVQQTLPSFSLTPAPIGITSALTWSPSLTFTNARQYNQIGPIVPAPPRPGDTLLPVDTLRTESRSTTLQVGTPLRLGSWTWNNQLSVTDQAQDARQVLVLVDLLTGDTAVRTFGYDVSTAVQWETGINLPTLFGSSWKLVPSLGITNTTTGPFLLRNRATGGAFVRQGKRFTVGARMTPSFFGFFPGLGPLERIRHQVSPIVQWSWAPAADVPEAFARAIVAPGQAPRLRSPAQQRVSVSLSQIIEGKLRLPAGDTTTDPRNAPKIKLLSLVTSGLTYDFEQAKEPGRTGWATQQLTNQLTSDLLPGLTLRLTHDLWDGPVGFDTTRFSPFLRTVSARFRVTERTFAGLLGLLTGRPGSAVTPAPDTPDDTAPPEELLPDTEASDPYEDADQRSRGRQRGRQPVTASVSYDETRVRPIPGVSGAAAPPPTRTLGLSLAFDPTPNWSVSWTTQYDLATRRFASHALRLERDLHRWRATFQFQRAPNGNFAFNFFITLLDQPEIKFQYDQQTIDAR